MVTNESPKLYSFFVSWWWEGDSGVLVPPPALYFDLVLMHVDGAKGVHPRRAFKWGIEDIVGDA